MNTKRIEFKLSSGLTVSYEGSASQYELAMPLKRAELDQAFKELLLEIDRLRSQKDADKVDAQPFGLGAEQIDRLQSNSLKPEEIAGKEDVQARRVRELLHWFARFAEGNANPKWLRGHAFELAYYVATTDDRGPINLQAIEDAAYLEGTQISESDRGILVRLGKIPASFPVQPDPAMAPQDWIDNLTHLMIDLCMDDDAAAEIMAHARLRVLPVGGEDALLSLIEEFLERLPSSFLTLVSAMQKGKP